MSTSSFFSRFYLSIFVILVLVACNDPNPQLELFEEEIKILTDVMLLEGVLQDFTGAQKDSLAKVNYDLLYDRHGISEEGLQELRQRFSEDPTLWSRAADSIEVRLKAGRADFETLLNAGLK